MSGVTGNPNVSATNGTEPLVPEAPQQSKAGKSKEEIYLELANLSHQSFRDRQSYEWKIAFGLWVGIGAFTYFGTEHAGAISGLGLFWLAAAYVLIGAVWLFVWQPNLHSANRRDKAWKHYYMHRAENRKDTERAPDPWRDESKIPWHQRWWEPMIELKRPWAWVQVLATWVFLALSFGIIQANSNQVPIANKKDAISISGDNVAKVLDKLTK